MALRKIVHIDEELCNGCGDCVTGCAEGALQIIDGKARLVRDDFCDGFGDCIGHCPTGALTIEEREADDYDESATRIHVEAVRGATGLQEFDRAAAQHETSATASRTPAAGGQVKPEPLRPRPVPPSGGGCPGSRMRVPSRTGGENLPPIPLSSTGSGGDPGTITRPELQQWPVMLHLVPPRAPFLKNRELVILSTCSPVAMPDVQWRFVRGRAVVVACPKLDRTEGYVEKLAAMLAEPSIPAVTVVRMEVPCCGGLTSILVQAAERCGRDDLVVREATVSVGGELQQMRDLG